MERQKRHYKKREEKKTEIETKREKIKMNIRIEPIQIFFLNVQIKLLITIIISLNQIKISFHQHKCQILAKIEIIEKFHV